jgi:hypothetical protein
MKQFKTNLDHLPPKGKPKAAAVCELDGRRILFSHPGDDALVMMLAATGASPTGETDPAAGAAAMFRLMAVCMTKEDNAHVLGRLWDREDPFTTEQFVDLFEWLVTELTGEDPTRRSDSSAPPSQTGGDSTPE